MTGMIIINRLLEESLLSTSKKKSCCSIIEPCFSNLKLITVQPINTELTIDTDVKVTSLYISYLFKPPILATLA